MQPEDLIPASEFCMHHNIQSEFIDALQDYGLIEVVLIDKKPFISAEEYSIIEKFMRMHYELNINFEGIDAIHHLLEKMEAVQQQLTSLQNRLRFYEP